MVRLSEVTAVCVHQSDRVIIRYYGLCSEAVNVTAFSRLTFMTKGTPVLQCQRNTASGVMSEAIVEILSGVAVLHHTNVKIKVHFLTEEE